MSGIHNEKCYSSSLSFLPPPKLSRKLGTRENSKKIQRIEYIAINFWPITNKIQLMFVNTCRATFSGEKHINIIEKQQATTAPSSQTHTKNHPSSLYTLQQQTEKHKI